MRRELDGSTDQLGRGHGRASADVRGEEGTVEQGLKLQLGRMSKKGEPHRRVRSGTLCRVTSISYVLSHH